LAELITFLIAIPLLYVIGDFYYRLGVGLCRVLGPALRAVAASCREASPAPGDGGQHHAGR
jgi:hypothetical protein